jgi:hypothetical protein
MFAQRPGPRRWQQAKRQKQHSAIEDGARFLFYHVNHSRSKRFGYGPNHPRRNNHPIICLTIPPVGAKGKS